MANPLFKNSKGDNVNSPSNPLNEANKTYHQSRNTFVYDRPHFTTACFADVTPYEVVEGVGEDVLEFGNKHHIRTYTLQSPLMSDLFMKKSYYMLDMRSILPNNWDKIYREPAHGSDVPVDGSVNTYVENLFSTIHNICSSISVDGWNSSELSNLFRFVFFLESIFSDASLFARLYNHYSNLVYFVDDGGDLTFYGRMTFDEAINILYSNINSIILESFQQGVGYFYLEDFISERTYSIPTEISFVHALEYVRTYPERYNFISTVSSVTVTSIIDELLHFISTMRVDSVATASFPVNYARVAAYQLVCSEYFTNDKVDNIYSAELYRQNMYGLYRRFYGTSFPTFVYNGVDTLYDCLSGKYLAACLTRLLQVMTKTVPSSLGDISDYVFGYLENLFSIRKSLRYGDYFTGARPEPYAAVDMDAEVIDGKVSAIDSTRSILAQRFANAVARSGRKFSDYLTDVIGGYDVPDVTVPRWLASKTSKVSGFEVENTTSENQGNIVTVLNSANSDYIYSVEAGSPCIIIGVMTFSMERYYSESLDRFSFHKDRDDMFNKFMQFVGDQDVEAREYKANLVGSYAYQIRHMEYKQRFPVVSGGWRKFLPPMFMIADNVIDIESDQHEYTINEYNIRSLNSDFDGFYASLTNFGLASRFHFFMKMENRCTAKRMMARQPSIL